MVSITFSVRFKLIHFIHQRSWTWPISPEGASRNFLYVDVGYVIKKLMKNSCAKFQLRPFFSTLKRYIYVSNRNFYGFKNKCNKVFEKIFSAYVPEDKFLHFPGLYLNIYRIMFIKVLKILK